MIHIAKGRPGTVYNFPLPPVQAGTTWAYDLRVWDADGAPSVLTPYAFSATIDDGNGYIIARGEVTTPTPGVIRWTFTDPALTRFETDVYRFVLDAEIDGMTQRLIDARLPVKAGTGFAGVRTAVPTTGGGGPPEPPITPPTVPPSAANTGPTGTLVNMTGNILANVPGSVIENIRLIGTIDVTASDVTIRNCEINASGQPFGIDGSGVDDLRVENVRLVATGCLNGLTVGNDAIVLACDIAGSLVGIAFDGADIIMQGNYIHDLMAPSTGLKSTRCSGVLIRSNTIDNAGTANVSLKTDIGPISGVAVVYNWLQGRPAYNVVVDIGAGASVVTAVEIGNNTGQRGTSGLADLDPTIAGNVSIHDNTLN